MTVVSYDIENGKGSQAIAAGDKVQIKYTGWHVTDNEQQLPILGGIYDSKGDGNVTFTVGQGTVSKGLEQGIIGMKKDGKRLVVVPAAVAGTANPIIYSIKLNKMKRETNEAAGAAAIAAQMSQLQRGGGSNPALQHFSRAAEDVTIQQVPEHYNPQSPNYVQPGYQDPMNSFQSFQRMQQNQQGPVGLLGGPASVQQQQIQQQMGMGMMVQPGLPPTQQIQQMPQQLGMPQQPFYPTPMYQQPAPQADPAVVALQNAATVNAITQMGSQLQGQITAQQQASQSSIEQVLQKLHILTDKMETIENHRLFKKAGDAGMMTGIAITSSIAKIIADNDQFKSEIAEKDEKINSLKDKLTELRRKNEVYVKESESLLEEKKSAVNNASESRLEMEREMNRLREQLARANAERDDSQRHLLTVKKLLELSDEELQKCKQRLESLDTSAQADQERVNELQRALRDEKANRRAAQDRCTALRDELAEEKEAHQRTQAALDERKRKAEDERTRLIGQAEEDRASAVRELERLRDELTEQLKAKDRKMELERQRTQEEWFAKGKEEGASEGRVEAESLVKAQMEGLQGKIQAQKVEIEALSSSVSSLKDALTTTEKDKQEKAQSILKLHQQMEEQAREAEEAARRQLDRVKGIMSSVYFKVEKQLKKDRKERKTLKRAAVLDLLRDTIKIMTVKVMTGAEDDEEEDEEEDDEEDVSPEEEEDITPAPPATRVTTAPAAKPAATQRAVTIATTPEIVEAEEDYTNGASAEADGESQQLERASTAGVSEVEAEIGSSVDQRLSDVGTEDLDNVDDFPKDETPEELPVPAAVTAPAPARSGGTLFDSDNEDEGPVKAAPPAVPAPAPPAPAPVQAQANLFDSDNEEEGAPSPPVPPHAPAAPVTTAPPPPAPTASSNLFADSDEEGADPLGGGATARSATPEEPAAQREQTPEPEEEAEPTHEETQDEPTEEAQPAEEPEEHQDEEQPEAAEEPEEEAEAPHGEEDSTNDHDPLGGDADAATYGADAEDVHEEAPAVTASTKGAFDSDEEDETRPVPPPVPKPAAAPAAEPAAKSKGLFESDDEDEDRDGPPPLPPRPAEPKAQPPAPVAKRSAFESDEEDDAAVPPPLPPRTGSDTAAAPAAKPKGLFDDSD
eukprot:TRINITY_DN2410_c0_g1_i1.p1 TRINITY_DN2410_c0_g1~~TRINITY_DN2410_c0_g1_i1.p1  ORF type:complete len:1264 (-),score=314.09 TRINITY_DN2410_c0_g1_i1:427-3849(-)